jgi:hypothetical protein
MTSIAFSPLVPIPLIVALGIIAAAMIAYGVLHRARGALLRALPVAALLIAIADPQLVRENRTPLKDIVTIVVDESDSQKLGERSSRTEKALERLSAELKAMPDIDVRTVRAGAANGAQDGTRLFEALSSAIGDVPPQRLAGSIIISDGQVHDAPPPARATQAGYVKAPLHLLITGERKEYDRRIRVENAPDFDLVGNTAKVRLRVEDTAAAPGSYIPVIIKRNNGAPQQIDLPVGTPAEVPVLIENAGANVFEVEAVAAPGEISTLNNRTLISINGVRDRMRVLLISGQPHVGERAWRNLLKSDPNVDLVHFTILRPPEIDDATPVDELALIPFPMHELFEEQLQDFDLVIFDRYTQTALIRPQHMAAISNYVRRGGAVMLAVGAEYADGFTTLFGTALQTVLPAEPTGDVFDGAFRPRLSDTGRRHPVTASLEGAAANDAEPSWGRWLRQVGVTAATGEQVLTGRDNTPLLILNRVGEGRVALLLSDTVWLWGKGFEGGGPQTELLRRVSHWLMKEPELDEEALTAEVRGNGLQIIRRSLSPEEKPVEVTYPDGASLSVTPKSSTAGAFSTFLEVTQPGLYSLTDGTKTAIVAVGTPNPLETFDVVATDKKVRPLTEASGGGVFWLEDAVAPSIRRTVPDRVARGAGWLGLKANDQFTVTGVSQTPLSPIALMLLAIMGGAMLAWWREGR